MNKVKNPSAPEHICNIFYKQFKNYNLRSGDFPIPSCNTVNYGKHSIRYLGPYLCETIDKDLRDKASPRQLKKSSSDHCVQLFWTEDVAAMHA